MYDWIRNLGLGEQDLFVHASSSIVEFPTMDLLQWNTRQHSLKKVPTGKLAEVKEYYVGLC